jgi:hypothetical protein
LAWNDPLAIALHHFLIIFMSFPVHPLPTVYFGSHPIGKAFIVFLSFCSVADQYSGQVIIANLALFFPEIPQLGKSPILTYT